MKVGKIVNLYFTEKDVKKMIVDFLELKGKSKLAKHVEDNCCSFDLDSESFLCCSVDGEIMKKDKTLNRRFIDALDKLDDDTKCHCDCEEQNSEEQKCLCDCETCQCDSCGGDMKRECHSCTMDRECKELNDDLDCNDEEDDGEECDSYEKCELNSCVVCEKHKEKLEQENVKNKIFCLNCNREHDDSRESIKKCLSGHWELADEETKKDQIKKAFEELENECLCNCKKTKSILDWSFPDESKATCKCHK